MKTLFKSVVYTIMWYIGGTGIAEILGNLNWNSHLVNLVALIYTAIVFALAMNDCIKFNVKTKTEETQKEEP